MDDKRQMVTHNFIPKRTAAQRAAAALVLDGASSSDEGAMSPCSPQLPCVYLTSSCFASILRHALDEWGLTHSSSCFGCMGR